MDEVFPVLSGVVLGLVTVLVRPVWLKAIFIGSIGPAFGFCASWISGELTISWVYLLIDTIQVVGAAVATAILIRIWLRHQARRLAL